MFFLVNGSKFNRTETLDSLMYGMTLDEFLDYKNYIDMQIALEQAAHKDMDEEAERQRKLNKNKR